MSDVKDLLNDAVGSYEPRADLEALERRVRRRQRFRRATAATLAMAMFAGPGWLAWSALRPAGQGSAGTQSSSGTYLLEDFEVSPHVDPVTGAISTTDADVAFQVRWSSPEFPGGHECMVSVRDTAGNEIGSLTFQLESLIEARTKLPAVPVTGPIDGATAEGSCSDERLDTPVAYEITDVGVAVGEGVTVTYVVGWPDSLGEGEYPGTNACTVALWEGQTLLEQRSFTLGAPEGLRQEETFPRDAVGQQIVATVTCEPFASEGVFPDPVPPSGAQPSPNEDVASYEDPLGWTVEVPVGWQVLPFRGSDGRITMQGAAISNVPLPPTTDGTYPDLSDLFPDGAALIVSHREGGPAPDLLTDDSAFPLRWEDFQAIPGGVVIGSTQPFRANGLDFVLELAVRADAPEELLRNLQAIVTSIEPVTLTEGEHLPSGYVVVSKGLVAEFGSGAVLELDRGPFLLIHAPGGYYALGLPSEVQPSAAFSWDEEAQEVVWMDDGTVFARYDREGRPILVPAGADLVPLGIHPVVQAGDGVHLLLHPESEYGPLPQELWP